MASPQGQSGPMGRDILTVASVALFGLESVKTICGVCRDFYTCIGNSIRPLKSRLQAILQRNSCPVYPAACRLFRRFCGIHHVGLSSDEHSDRYPEICAANQVGPTDSRTIHTPSASFIFSAGVSAEVKHANSSPSRTTSPSSGDSHHRATRHFAGFDSGPTSLSIISCATRFKRECS